LNPLVHETRQYKKFTGGHEKKKQELAIVAMWWFVSLWSVSL